MRGLAWAVTIEPATSGARTAVIAVVGKAVVLRGMDRRWRIGHYMDEEQASNYAVRMTESYETSMKGTLAAGPVEVAVPDESASDVRALGPMLCASLDLADPEADPGFDS